MSPRLHVPAPAGPGRAHDLPARPRVSVVMAAYNEERFIGEAIGSALAQDYPAELVEVIVVDDGSTDATAAIAERHARATGRVRVLRQANAGNVPAVQAGLACAGGDVIALLDADDVWPVDRLRRAVAVLVARPEVGLVYGDMIVIDADGKVLQPSWLAGDITPEGRCVGAQLAGNNVMGSTIVMRGSVVRALGPIAREAPWADWWFGVRCAEVSELAYLPAPRVLYRFHGENMSLGAQGERRRGELCKAARFQRRLLRTIPSGSATPLELAAGWEAFERNVREAIGLGASPFERVLDVSDADRAEGARLVADGERRLASGDAVGALWPCVRGAAADPWSAAARAALAVALAAAPGGEELPGQRPLAGAAAFVVLAAADELLERPALLRAYAAAMAGADGVTLAIDTAAMDAATAGEALGALVAEAGVDDALDVLAVAGPLDELGRARLDSGVHAVLTERDRGALTVPHFGAADAPALRRLAA